MRSADDCGKLEGDNTGSTGTCRAGSLPTTPLTGCANLWVLEGMTGPARSPSSANLACPTPGYVCTKPITSLTMKWTGTQCIRIAGTAGGNPATPFDIDNICPNDVVTVSGYQYQ
jgi:hypothetical protein